MVSKLLDYDVKEVLGEGAKSIIYLVADPATGRKYALKHVKREIPKDIRFIEQMETEYEISRQFSHPNLRRTFKLEIKKRFFQVTDAFLVMEYFEGLGLDVRPPGTLLETVDTFIKTSEGLKALHAMGWVHADLKPNNILRNNDGDVKIIDFGQSCKTGMIKDRIQGTPDYIAPEQVNRRPLDLRTDVFNLGATMYWALTYKPIPTLYTAGKKENSFVLTDRIPKPHELDPRIPEPLSKLVIECIATTASKRPESMDQVITRLELVKHIMQKQGAGAAAMGPAGGGAPGRTASKASDIDEPTHKR